MNQQVTRSLACLAIPVVILMFPPPDGLSLGAWRLFAVYLAAIAGIILRPFPEPVVLLAAMAAVAIFFKQISVALVGFSNATAWLVFMAFLVSQCFIDTGLGRRIAFLLIRFIGRTSLGLGYAIAGTDSILSMAIPSNTARTGGIVFPIFHNVARTLDSNPGETARKIGAYLMVLLYQISLVSSCMFLTGNVNNPLLASFAKNVMNVEITWVQWAMAMFPPGILVVLLTPWLVFKLCPATIGTIDNIVLGEKGLKELGPMSVKEKRLCAIFVLAVIGWATGTLTGIYPTGIAIGFLVLCVLSGVITWDNLAGVKMAWSTFIWYAGILSLATGLERAKFFEWLSKKVTASVNLGGVEPMVVLVGILVVSVAVRYFFASGAAFVSTLVPVFMMVGMAAKVPSLVLTYMLAATTLLGCLTTHYGNAAAPLIYGMGYVDQKTWWKVGHVVIFAGLATFLIVGLPLWKLMGLW